MRGISALNDVCINFTPATAEQMHEVFAVISSTGVWPLETYQDYPAPIIRFNAAGEREAIAATYGMVPKNHIPPDIKRYTTMNARAETVGHKRSYSPAWKAHQLCLVPMQAFFEPNWETGTHVRWRIGMADESPFAVAGLWRAWQEPDGTESHSFTQLTINADVHPLMRRFHKPGDEKRTLVIVPAAEYDSWLSCRDPEEARSFLRLYPPELMAARPAPMRHGRLPRPN